jgi:hypothetical protein
MNEPFAFIIFSVKDLYRLIINYLYGETFTTSASSGCIWIDEIETFAI